MSRQEILHMLSSHRDDLRQLGVRNLSLFGSAARDELTPQSDIDLLVEFDGPAGLFQVVRVQTFLESLLGRSVDVGTAKSLKPRISQRIKAEAIHVA